MTPAELAKFARVRPATALPWKWSGKRRGYVPQGSTLGETLITLGDTYEGGNDDCAYAETACNAFPGLIAALREAHAEAERLRAELEEAQRVIRGAIAAAPGGGLKVKVVGEP